MELAIVLAAAFTIIGCDGTAGTATVEQPLLVGADLGLEVEIGVREQGNPLALLHRVLDAAVIDEGVVVLDISPPFVRFFGRDGRFLGAGVPRGSGPGELSRPIGLGRFGHTVVVNEQNKNVVLSNHGDLIRTVTETQRYIRGVMGVCGDRVARLVSVPGAFEAPAALTTARDFALPEDTLVVFSAMRSNSLRVHPVLSASDNQRIVVYPEEVGHYRLTEIDCESQAVRNIPIDTLGRQEFFEPQGSNRFALLPAAVPRPGGIALVDGRIIWLVQDEIAVGVVRDSVSVFTLVESDGSQCRVQVRGWYHLLDSADGLVLLSSENPVGRVVLLNANALLTALTTRGVLPNCRGAND